MSLKKILKTSSNFERFLKSAEPDVAGWTTPHFPDLIYDPIHNLPRDVKPDNSFISAKVQSAIGARPDNILGNETYQKLSDWKAKHPEIKAQNAQDLFSQIESWWASRESAPIYMQNEDAFDPRVPYSLLSKEQKEMRDRSKISPKSISDSELASGMPGKSKDVKSPQSTKGPYDEMGSATLPGQKGKGVRMPVHYDDRNKQTKENSMSLRKLLKVAGDYQRLLKRADLQQIPVDELNHKLPRSVQYGEYFDPSTDTGTKTLHEPPSKVNNDWVSSRSSGSSGSTSTMNSIGPGIKEYDKIDKSDLLNAQVILNGLISKEPDKYGIGRINQDGIMGPQTAKALDKYRKINHLGDMSDRDVVKMIVNDYDHIG